MSNDKLIIINKNITSTPLKKTINDDEYMVLPVIALKVGVLNDIFYSSEEISKFHQSWNGVPITINHPIINNTNVSANHPQFESSVNVGRLFNVFYEDDFLKGELWINIDKTKKLGFDYILNHFHDGKKMEVSTGLYGDALEKKGTHKDSDYNFVVKNIRPDHLALLPEDTGACSISDGCGAMVYNKEVDLDKTKEKTEDELLSNCDNNIDEKENIVNDLIANKNPTFKEDDYDSLLKIDFPILKKIKDITEANSFTESDIVFFNKLKEEHEKKLDFLRDFIVKNSQNLTKDNVSKMDEATLNAVSKDIGMKSDYTAKSGTFVKSNPAEPYKYRSIIKANNCKKEVTNG